MAGGRPSAYDPAFCEQAIEFLEQGYSTTALAGHFRVSRQTVYNWADEHPEFFDALKTGQALSAIWWENKLRAIAKGEDGNATAAIFGLKNRVSDDWREKQELEHTGKNGGPIQTETKTTLANLSDEELAQLERLTDKARNPEGMGEAD